MQDEPWDKIFETDNGLVKGADPCAALVAVLLP